jgi:DNA polymerase III subunit epsilon
MDKQKRICHPLVHGCSIEKKMIWIIVAIIAAVVLFVMSKRKGKSDLSVLPERFVVFDLETTGLDPEIHEIIEIGAIRVNRDSDNHDSFQALIRPRKNIPKKVTEITGITQDLLEKEGEPLESAIPQFLEFLGELPIVSFNAEFDMAFLKKAVSQTQAGTEIKNRVSCALKMARRAWPGRKSYRLADIAKDSSSLSEEGTHWALGDCKRAMIVYAAAASKLGRAT